MRKVEYDFLVWTSFPSSLKMVNDEAKAHPIFPYEPVRELSVKPGAKVTVTVNVKFQNTRYGDTHVAVDGFTATRERRRLITKRVDSGRGTLDWKPVNFSFDVPGDVVMVTPIFWAGAGNSENPGVSWFDDFKIYQDGKLIYANDFNNWNPIIGTGVGASVGGIGTYLITQDVPLTIGLAVVGGVAGGVASLLTAKP